MEIRLNKTPGYRNDLLMILPRSEIDDVLLHIANRDRLRQLPGLLRHVARQDAAERQQVNAGKIPVEAHLQALAAAGHALVDEQGRPRRRLVVIGSRNLGNNHGFVAWQKDAQPRFFCVAGDPINYPAYSCLVRQENGELAVRSLTFSNDRVFDGDIDISAAVTWCCYANPVLRAGRVAAIEDIIDQCYDIRHVLAFETNLPEGRRIEAAIFQDYPQGFRDNALKALASGVPRQRFLHNAIGFSEDHVIILQREGTLEEIGHWLKAAGAVDGLILDNGASVFSWTWWAYPQGGFLFTAPDYRPNASAVLVFVLKGPAGTDLPGGSVSYSVV